MNDLSPGVVYSCIELVGLSVRQDIALDRLIGEFPKIGVCRAQLVLEASVALGWIASEGAFVKGTVRGHKVVGATSVNQMRMALEDLIDQTSPQWTNCAHSGRSRVLEFCPSGVRQLFEESGLADGSDDNAVAFWDRLSGASRGANDSWLQEIGRYGEKLTLELELRRTGLLPRWTALESNADGYDILSVVSEKDTNKLAIEVKATSLRSGGSFHLTKNEWAFACRSESYAIHLWRLTKPYPMLAILASEDIAEHVPTNMGRGEWEVFQIPFNAYKSRFSVQELTINETGGVS